MKRLIRKIEHDAEQFIYSCGFETREQAGKIKFSRITSKFEVLQLVENDSIIIVEKFLLHHLFLIITDDNAPEKYQTAIG